MTARRRGFAKRVCGSAPPSHGKQHRWRDPLRGRCRRRMSSGILSGSNPGVPISAQNREDIERIAGPGGMRASVPAHTVACPITFGCAHGSLRKALSRRWSPDGHEATIRTPHLRRPPKRSEATPRSPARPCWPAAPRLSRFIRAAAAPRLQRRCSGPSRPSGPDRRGRGPTARSARSAIRNGRTAPDRSERDARSAVEGSDAARRSPSGSRCADHGPLDLKTLERAADSAQSRVTVRMEIIHAPLRPPSP